MVEYRPLSFSWEVAEVAQAGAYDHYRDSFADLYDVGVDPHALGSFASRTSLTLFRAGVIAHGRSSPQTLIRTPDRIRRSGIDSVNLAVVNSRMVGDSDGRSLSSAGGTVHLQDLSRPSISRWDDLHIFNLTVPRAVGARLLAAADIHGAVLDGRSGAGRLISHHLRVFAQVASGLSEAEGEAAIAAALLLVERALGRENPPSAEQAAALRRTVREVAVRHMDRHLLSPELNIGTIAAACAVSRSTLYRAFEGHGGVAGQVQGMRLDRAREVLRLRHDGFPTVTDVAFDHGFASQPHFSRAYRDRFGYPPSEEPTLWGARTAAPPPAAGDIQHDRVASWLRGR